MMSDRKWAKTDAMHHIIYLSVYR